MITENNTVNEVEAEFDFNSFDWEKWNRDMKKAIDGLIEMAESFSKKYVDSYIDSPLMTEKINESGSLPISAKHQDDSKEGEGHGGKVQWWKKCFTRAKRNSQA